MGVERGAGARLAPEHVDIPRRRDMGETVFGEGAPVAVDAQQDSETQIEADVRTRVVDFLEPDGAARIGDEQAGPDARIRLQAAVAKFLVLEEAVARHQQQAQRDGLDVDRGPEIRDVERDAQPRQLKVVEPLPDPQPERGRAAAVQVLRLLLVEHREGQRAAAGDGRTEVGVQEPLRRGRGRDGEDREHDGQRNRQASHGRLIPHD